MEGETPNYKASPLGKGGLLLSHKRPIRSPAIATREAPLSPHTNSESRPKNDQLPNL